MYFKRIYGRENCIYWSIHSKIIGISNSRESKSRNQRHTPSWRLSKSTPHAFLASVQSTPHAFLASVQINATRLIVNATRLLGESQINATRLLGVCPNQRHTPSWRLSKSTPHAFLASVGYECAYGIPRSSLLQRRTIFCRNDLRIATYTRNFRVDRPLFSNRT